MLWGYKNKIQEDKVSLIAGMAFKQDSGVQYP